MSQVTEAEIIEYLWPRMGDYRRSVLVKHLIHGDQRSAERFLAPVKGHRPTLTSYHERVLLLDGQGLGGWRVEEAESLKLQDFENAD